MAPPNMAGELWRSAFQIGKETTPGTAVAATRKQYWGTDSVLIIERDPHVHRAALGRRDNVFGYSSGSIKAAGSLSLPLSAEESIEIFNLGLSASPVITTPASGVTARVWTYKPGDTDSATIEYNDGAVNWRGTGYRCNQLTLSGAVDGDNMLSADLFGTNATQVTATTGLTDRTPTFLEGWQARFYIEAFTGTPGTTVVSGFLTNWNVQINNNLDRVYTADNTLGANRTTTGELDVTASLTVDANSSQAQTEFTNWANTTARMLRLEFQDETRFIEGALRPFVTVDIPGNWTAVNIGGSGSGVRRYELSYQSVYSAAMAAMVQVRVQAARTAAF